MKNLFTSGKTLGIILLEAMKPLYSVFNYFFYAYPIILPSYKRGSILPSSGEFIPTTRYFGLLPYFLV